MGENWQEEARNGTMSLLSQITKAEPSLEEELVRLNQEAWCCNYFPTVRDVTADLALHFFPWMFESFESVKHQASGSLEVIV